MITSLHVLGDFLITEDEVGVTVDVGMLPRARVPAVEHADTTTGFEWLLRSITGWHPSTLHELDLVD